MKGNIKLGSLKKIFKGGGKKKTHPKDFKRGLNKPRDWKIIMISFMVLILVVCGLLYYIFTTIVKEDSREIITDGNTYKVIDKNELQKTIKEFENKAKLFEGVFSETPDIIDPSL